MTDNIKQQLEDEIAKLATKFSLTKIRTESQHFKREYTLQNDGSFKLTSEKAVIKALGKVSVVPIGENEKFKTFEEAEAWARQYWSDYFKKRRENRGEKEKRAEARRQKKYREKRKQEHTQFKRQK